MTQDTRPTRPATLGDLRRLVDLGRQRGLRLFESAPHTWWSTSHSDPFALHALTAFSCDCAGFWHTGRRTHHSLLLAHLGWLPEVEPEPEPCRVCHGRGQLWSEHYMELRPCYGCESSGTAPDDDSDTGLCDCCLSAPCRCLSAA